MLCAVLVAECVHPDLLSPYECRDCPVWQHLFQNFIVSGKELPSASSIRFCAFGDVGSGKDVSVVKEAVRYHWQYPNNAVYSNIELFNIPYKRVDSPSILFEINEPCFLYLSELWALANSRKSFSLINDVMSMLLIRSRRKGWRVGYTQQWYTQTDLKIRYITEVWFYPELLKNTVLHEEIYDKHADYQGERWYDATKFFDDFDTWADPFTLNLAELKECWERYQRDRGYI